jgi:hypothetical protein
MIDNTVVILESVRTPLAIKGVVLAYDETDEMREDYSSLSFINLENVVVEGEYITAWDSSPTLFQYNRIYFLDENEKVENIFKIKAKTQREIRVDLRIRQCNHYDITTTLTEC